MKRFLALWVVTIIFGALAGFVLSIIDYLFAEIGQTSSGYTCWYSIIHSECYSDRITFLGAYPYFSLLITVPGYILIRTVVGSFKVVFGKDSSHV